jgi:hypothetical protein
MRPRQRRHLGALGLLQAINTTQAAASTVSASTAAAPAEALTAAAPASVIAGGSDTK